ncbi:MAG: hypothetical protein AAGB34_05910 [Planctomycetota bacterium]
MREIVIAFIVVGFVGLVSTALTPGDAHADTQGKPSYLGTLEGPGYRIMIRSTASGVRYDLSDDAGRLIGEGLLEDELQSHLVLIGYEAGTHLSAEVEVPVDWSGY